MNFALALLKRSAPQATRLRLWLRRARERSLSEALFKEEME